MRILAFITFSITIIFTSCSTLKDNSINHLVKSSKCNQQNIYSYDTTAFPLALDEIEIDSLLLIKISKNSLHIANTIGIIPYLNEYINFKKNTATKHTLENQIQILDLKQKIYHKIDNASLAISAVSSELDCEEERISQIANYITEKQSNLESKLTIGAIILGATGSILSSGIIKDDKTSNAVAITTGVGEAAIGLTMLFNKRTIELKHERNILQDIWEGPKTSKLFPSFIWYYLNYEDENNPSLRNEIIEKWVQFGQIESNPNKMTDIYFDKSGEYNADKLNNRADMYDQLESQIYLLKQKLMVLSNEIENI